MENSDTWPELEIWSKANIDGVGDMIITGYIGALEDMLPDYFTIKFAGFGRRALDFGCGIGRNTIALANNFVEVVGYDLPNMINLVPEKNKLNNIEYTSDWENIKNKKFDVIIAYAVLQAIREKELREFLQDMSNMTDKIIIRNHFWLDDGNTELETLSVLRDYFNIHILRIQHEIQYFDALLIKK